MGSKAILILIISIFLVKGVSYGRTTYRNGTINLENSMVQKTLLASGKNPAPIKVTGYFDRKNSRELLHPDSNLPWFEFVVNKQKVTSNDPYWVLESISEKELRNGGNHVELHFRAASGPVEGLHIVVY